MKYFLFVSILSAVFFRTPAQEKLVITGDSFVGRKVNGQEIRKFIGNVVIKQGDIKATCDTAEQNLLTDVARLIGRVIIVQDTVKLTTNEGYYFGKEQKALSYKGISLFNGHIVLSADSGVYFAKKKFAIFTGNVLLKDSLHQLFSRKLIHYEKNDSNVAIGKVKFSDSSSVIYSDSLVFIRSAKFANAKGNVLITDSSHALKIFSGELKSFDNGNHIVFLKKPLLMRKERLENKTIDTLLISAKRMEAFNDSSGLLIARDSVKILRGEFSSINAITYYFRNKKNLLTFKDSAGRFTPIIWYGNIQLTADTIKAYLRKNFLKKVIALGNGIIISRIRKFNNRFNQISGDSLYLFFKKGKLVKTVVNGGVLSIYYLFEENNTPNGLIKSSAKKAVIKFYNGRVSYVKLIKEPVSEYHPESLIKGNEKDFLLPAFKIYNGKPFKNKLINSAKLNKNWGKDD